MEYVRLGSSGLKVSRLTLGCMSFGVGGFLGDFRSLLLRFTPEAMAHNQALVDLLIQIGNEKNATPAQIALAWLLAKKPWIVPIPGTTKLDRLKENLGATDVVLTGEDMNRIERAATAIQIEGDRYPAQLQAMVGR